MAKEKDSTLSKEERKGLKRAEKDKKRSDSDGVHKSKDKKEKTKKRDRAALAEKVANAVESGAVVVEGVQEVAVKIDVEGENENENEDKKKAKVLVRPVGALVPFANPLADEKVAKKVFKGVKKGVCMPAIFFVRNFARKRLPFGWGLLVVRCDSIPRPVQNTRALFPFQKIFHTNVSPPPFPPHQPQQPNPSNAASKKSSKRSANPPPLLPRLLPA